MSTKPIDFASAGTGRKLIDEHGALVADAENAFSFKKPARVVTQAAPSHKGFTTEGYPPGYVEAAKERAFADLRAWAAALRTSTVPAATAWAIPMHDSINSPRSNGFIFCSPWFST